MTEIYQLDKNDFLLQLETISSLKFGKFTLASGKKSNYYLDLRIIPYHPELFNTLMKEFSDKLIKELKFDLVCGVPLAGIPLATLISFFTRKPLIMLRKEPKKHGLGRLIEGGDVTNKKVLLIDDLISSGHSKEIFISHLRENRAIVEDLAVIVDRRDRTDGIYAEWEKEMQVSISSLFELSKEEILSYKNNKGV